MCLRFIISERALSASHESKFGTLKTREKKSNYNTHKNSLIHLIFEIKCGCKSRNVDVLRWYGSTKHFQTKADKYIEITKITNKRCNVKCKKVCDKDIQKFTVQCQKTSSMTCVSIRRKMRNDTEMNKKQNEIDTHKGSGSERERQSYTYKRLISSKESNQTTTKL